jgi:hypothetical protein
MKFRQSLFWDTDLRNIDIKKNSVYIIERILEFGRDSEIKWLWKTYKKSLLKKVVADSKSLRPKTKNLWELVMENQ